MALTCNPDVHVPSRTFTSSVLRIQALKCHDVQATATNKHAMIRVGTYIQGAPGEAIYKVLTMLTFRAHRHKNPIARTRTIILTQLHTKIEELSFPLAPAYKPDFTIVGFDITNTPRFMYPIFRLDACARNSLNLKSKSYNTKCKQTGEFYVIQLRHPLSNVNSYKLRQPLFNVHSYKSQELYILCKDDINNINGHEINT